MIVYSAVIATSGGSKVRGKSPQIDCSSLMAVNLICLGSKVYAKILKEYKTDS